MKMTKEHYEIVNTAINNLLNQHTNITHEFIDKNKSIILNRTTINNESGLAFICNVLYKYLNDNHIQTAVNRIINKRMSSMNKAL